MNTAQMPTGGILPSPRQARSVRVGVNNQAG